MNRRRTLFTVAVVAAVVAAAGAFAAVAVQPEPPPCCPCAAEAAFLADLLYLRSTSTGRAIENSVVVEIASAMRVENCFAANKLQLISP